MAALTAAIVSGDKSPSRLSAAAYGMASDWRGVQSSSDDDAVALDSAKKQSQPATHVTVCRKMRIERRCAVNEISPRLQIPPFTFPE